MADYSVFPPELWTKIDIPRDVCQHCGVNIEYFNNVWWQTGTCRSNCSTGTDWVVGSLHEPGGDPPPIGDPVLLDQWLDS